MSLPKEVQKRLGHYVYGLIDPRDNSIFYVGKASANNRAFDHLKGSKEAGLCGSTKQQKIQEILASNNKPRVDIIRHGLANEDVAFEVEAAVIDAIGMENLTNEVRGHSINRGRFSSLKAIRLYGSETIKTTDLPDKAIGFFIKNTYFPNMKPIELYDATRQFWRVGDKARARLDNGELTYKYAFAIVDSVIIAVYEIKDWFNAGSTMSTRMAKDDQRSEFIGKQLENHELINKKLVDDNNQGISAAQIGFTYFD